jgi:hypothetical protein
MTRKIPTSRFNLVVLVRRDVKKTHPPTHTTVSRGE